MTSGSHCVNLVGYARYADLAAHIRTRSANQSDGILCTRKLQSGRNMQDVGSMVKVCSCTAKKHAHEAPPLMFVFLAHLAIL